MSESIPSIEGVVARVLNSRELVINRGQDDGVRSNDVFAVLEVHEDIRDPESGDSLGSLERTKVRVRVFRVERRFSVARTFETYSAPGIGLPDFRSGSSRRVRTLERDSSVDPMPVDPDKAIVSVGDPVRLEIRAAAQDGAWDWFAGAARAAVAAAAGLDVQGYEEFAVSLLDANEHFNRTQLKLATEKAQIGGVGYPIGDTAGGVTPFEVGGVAGSRTKDPFQYWALGPSGQFYSMSALFEDFEQELSLSRTSENGLLADLRIARVIEVFLFLTCTYAALGLSSSRVTVRMVLGGLTGRELRLKRRPDWIGMASSIDKVESTALVELSIDGNRSLPVSQWTTAVKTLLTPAFEVFDFATLPDDVYTYHVQRHLEATGWGPFTQVNG